MNRTLYSGLSYLAVPAAVARLLYLSSRGHSGYRKNISQRFGYSNFANLAKFDSQPIWLHAVSVGEVIAAEPFVNGLLAAYPSLEICITTTTPTGADQVARSFGGSFASRVFCCYAPYDLPDAVNRFLERLNPCALVIMETELWPNWISLTAQKQIPSILINGRLSEKSATGYAKLGRLSVNMFEEISCVSAQSKQDAQRFERLGTKNVLVTGNLKADFKLDDQHRDQASLISDEVGLSSKIDTLIAASTHKGEDGLIVEAFLELRKKNEKLRLILVPRHPERAAEIANICDSKSIGFRLRTGEEKLDDQHPVLIANRLGELRALYGLAGIAIIGGTFIDHGGHNPLEPAAWGAAIVAGPSQRNFDSVFRNLESLGGLKRVEVESQSLSVAIAHLLSSQSSIEAMGQAALQYLKQNRGATQANLRLVAGTVGL